MSDWVPPKTLSWIKQERLLLDPENPRIASDSTLTQDQLLAHLIKNESLEEIADSMSRSGFFIEEPLVTIPGPENKLIVVEGNRRLATVKGLLAEDRKKIGTQGWPTISDEVRRSLSMLPVVEYQLRDEVLAFIGFRHITGIKKWGYFARSRYVKQLVDSGKDLPEIETILGDESGETRRLYQAAVVLQQMRDLGTIDMSAVRKDASLLEVTLSQQPIKDYLGIDRRLPTTRVDGVVAEDKTERLIEVAGYVFGNSETGERPVIAESRDINKKLAPVIGSEPAREHLKSTRDLDAAQERVGGEERYVTRKLQVALRALEEASKYLPKYREHPEISALKSDIRKYLEAL